MRVFSYPQPNPRTWWTHLWSPSENLNQIQWVHFGHSPQGLNISTPELAPTTWAPRTPEPITRAPRTQPTLWILKNPFQLPSKSFHDFEPLEYQAPSTQSTEKIWMTSGKKLGKKFAKIIMSQPHRPQRSNWHLQLSPHRTRSHSVTPDSYKWSWSGSSPGLAHSLRAFEAPWWIYEQHS